MGFALGTPLDTSVGRKLAAKEYNILSGLDLTMMCLRTADQAYQTVGESNMKIPLWPRPAFERDITVESRMIVLDLYQRPKLDIIFVYVDDHVYIFKIS